MPLRPRGATGAVPAPRLAVTLALALALALAAPARAATTHRRLRQVEAAAAAAAPLEVVPLLQLADLEPALGAPLLPEEAEPCAIPMIHDPVCACGRPDVVFPNRYAADCAAEPCVESCFEAAQAGVRAGLDVFCACPLLLDPVCANGTQEYPNACAAECSGATDFANGTCNATAPVEVVEGVPVEEPAKERANEEALPACPCPRILMPVCDAGDGVTEYPNSCVAECRGAAFTPGPCGAAVAGRGPADGGGAACACPAIYQPVCHEGIEYGNACAADCAGVVDFAFGPCPPPADDGVPPHCQCVKILDPVCGAGGVEFDNDCLARCAGVFDYAPGRCAGD